jgi:hypothetical protein
VRELIVASERWWISALIDKEAKTFGIATVKTVK